MNPEPALVEAGRLSATWWRRLDWSWRWLLLELVTIAVLAVVSLAPALRSHALVQWAGLGVGALVFVGAMVLGWGFYFYAPPVTTTGGDCALERAWQNLPQARRRELAKTLRSGRADQIPREHRPIATWYCTRTLTRGLTMTTGQIGFGPVWTALSLIDSPNSIGLRWLHVVLGLLFAVLGVVAVRYIPGQRRSLAQMRTQREHADPDTA